MCRYLHIITQTQFQIISFLPISFFFLRFFVSTTSPSNTRQRCRSRREVNHPQTATVTQRTQKLNGHKYRLSLLPVDECVTANARNAIKKRKRKEKKRKKETETRYRYETLLSKEVREKSKKKKKREKKIKRKEKLKKKKNNYDVCSCNARAHTKKNP